MKQPRIEKTKKGIIKTTVVLAIDPGPVESGYVLWNGKKILDMGKITNGKMINVIYVADDPTLDVVAVEMVASYGMAVGATVFETCVWIGRFVEATQIMGYNDVVIFRKDVKIQVAEILWIYK